MRTNADEKLAKAREALELVLLFYDGNPWTVEKCDDWKKITGTFDASTRTMCDHIRKVLKEC